MKAPIESPIVGPDVDVIALKRALRWGLSAHLPRWQSFDGRRSQLAFARRGSAMNELARAAMSRRFHR